MSQNSIKESYVENWAKREEIRRRTIEELENHPDGRLPNYLIKMYKKEFNENDREWEKIRVQELKLNLK